MNNSLRLLRDRNFGPYLTGNLLSNCGTWFQNLAQSLLVYRLTKSTFMVGVVNFAQFIGMFALSPWSGSAADRFDRRRLLVVTQLGAVAVTGAMAVLSATGHATAGIVIALAVILGLTTAFAIPALMALIPLLVVPEDLGPAVALNSVSFTLARGVGPLLGALVIHELGISAAFGLNAASYLALIGALAIIKPTPQAPRPAQRPQLRDTLRVLRDDTRLAALMAVVVAVSLSQDPVSTLTPGFAKQLLHHPDVYSGVLIGAFGVGSAVAGFYLASRTSHSVRRLPYTCGLMGVSMALFALSPSLVTASVCLFFGGIGFLASNTTATTIVQLEVDDAQRGRVMALWSASFLGIRPFASLGDGGIAAAGGLRTAAFVMAIPALVAAVVGGLRLRGRARVPTHPSELDEVELGEVEVETQL
ncbi:MAG: MFS transporter [Actinobacteria bacterium]|nr:MFS transporter [Actinomycetota bacterium]MBV9255047.1 MFS transporter [Actinomycetota bacterium]MBV9934375.1 MFS transporter [Actinomycetota bacterium]